MKKQKVKLITFFTTLILVLSMVFLTACGASMPSEVRNPNKDSEAQVQILRDAGWQWVRYTDMKYFSGIGEAVFIVNAMRVSITSEELIVLYENEDNFNDQAEFIWNGRVWWEEVRISYYKTAYDAKRSYQLSRRNGYTRFSFEHSYGFVGQIPSGVSISNDFRRNGNAIILWGRLSGSYQSMSTNFKGTLDFIDNWQEF